MSPARDAPTSAPPVSVGYPDRAGAKEVAKFMVKTGKPGVHAYRCAECRDWHIGHLPGAVLRGEVSADEWYRR